MRANHPNLKTKLKNGVSINCGLCCTHEMAIEDLDELASMLIETGIAPNLKQIEPGISSRKIDISGKVDSVEKKGIFRKCRRLWLADKRKSRICHNIALQKFQRGLSSLPSNLSGAGHNS